MKKLRYLLLIFVLLLATFNIGLSKKTTIVYADTTATISMEASSKRVLSGTNIHTKKYIALTIN